MTSNPSWRWALGAVFMLLAACAGPRPPALPPATLSSGAAAVVRGGPALETFIFGRGMVTVTRIDQTALVDGNNRSLYGAIEVTPGSHVVYFNYRHAALCLSSSACGMSLEREQRLALVAEAGHVYRVGATYRDGRLWYWIADESNNRLVSGETPAGADWASGSQGFGGGTLF